MKTSIFDAVILPGIQAFVTALVLGMAGYSVSWWLKSENAFGIAVSVFSFALLVSWLFYRAEWRSRIDALYGVEKIEPEIKELSVTVHQESNQGISGDFLRLPGGLDRFRDFSKAVVDGKPITVRNFTGAGGLYSQAEFDKLRSELIARGFLAWRSNHDNRGGVYVTSKGLATFRFVAGSPSGGRSSVFPELLRGQHKYT